jgi:class 3 adenylate cyclase
MGWSRQTAEERIKAHLRTVPAIQPGVTLRKHYESLLEARKSALKLPRTSAILVDGVHIYGQLLDFESMVADGGHETDQSHARFLRFLNIHYQIWDAVVDGDGAHRVDYHGPRLHAIVSEPANDSREQLRRAIALAVKLAEAGRRVSQPHGFPSRIRFGIGHGPCLALTTGRAHERDTLFLGRPANHAAKLAAASDQEGIFLTPDSLEALGADTLSDIPGQRILKRAFVEEAVRAHRFDRIDEVANQLAMKAPSEVEFKFHRAAPPLSKLTFRELTPSKSVRMGLASIFADVHGFTAFVDDAIRGGSEAIKKAVTTIHVIREELNSVLKDDFGGKRVRFIGDCIHGLIAAGERQDDPAGSVKDAALCASGMKSSFSLVQETLGGLDRLDLAVGVEYGSTPITRIGEQGEDSVRCSVSRAVVESERMQQSIEGGGIRFGRMATSVAGAAVNKAYGSSRALPNYAAAADLLGLTASPVAATVRLNPSARPHAALIKSGE